MSSEMVGMDGALALAREELLNAITRFDPFHGPHEGYAATLDEVRLYLDALRNDQVRDPDRLYKLTRSDLAWFGITGAEVTTA